METTVETPVFDESAIERLRAVVGSDDPGFLQEMTSLFVEESARSVEELRQARDRADWPRVSRLAHALKSSAATFGLMRLAEACQALERNTRGGVADAATPELAARLLTEYEQAVPVVKTLR